MQRSLRILGLLAGLLILLVIAMPILGVMSAWLMPSSHSSDVFSHLWQTVLPEYFVQSALLAFGVGVGVILVGAGAAATVTLFEFPLRRYFEWLLLMPLAMPAYVLAYVYTDALQYSGPLQTALRDAWGLKGALWPDVRSLPAAIVLFVLTLYPYVYLLTRTALAVRGVQLMEAARLLGAGFWRRVYSVALPLARPAIAAGLALAMMETLADYGVGAFFGLNTFSTGIFKAWLVLNNALVAAQLASVLLILVGLLLWLERRAQKQMRFANSRHGYSHAADSQPVVLQGGLAIFAFTLCALPVLLGFFLPVLWLCWQIWQEAIYADLQLPISSFGKWAWNSFLLAAMSAGLAAALATLLAFGVRTQHWNASQNHRAIFPKLLVALARTISLSYAIPGGIIAIGILIPLGILQSTLPSWGLSTWVTGTIMGLIYAYLVRFSAVAVQTLEAGYTQISPHIDETARLLGHNRWQLLPQVHLPLLRKSMVAAILLVFVDVMKELPATLVLRPFGSDTLAVMAYQLARDERLAEAALPSMAIVLVGLIPVLLLSKALRPAHSPKV